MNEVTTLQSLLTCNYHYKTKFRYLSANIYVRKKGQHPQETNYNEIPLF